MQRRLDEYPAENLKYWGKASPAGWHPLLHHSLDVAATGMALLQGLPALQGRLAQRLGLTTEQTAQWVAFWLSLHDLGKFAESFQSQRADLYLEARGRAPDPAKPYTLRHDSLGMLCWADVVRPVLLDQAWFGLATEDLADGMDAWMRASSGHHGQPPQPGGHWRQHFDAIQDKPATLAHVHCMRQMFLTDDLAVTISGLDARGFLSASQELSWWMAGLAVLADWLGSNTDYFPYIEPGSEPITLAEYWHGARRKAARAVAASGVVAPASAAALHFGELFPELAAPSPLQRWAAEVRLAPGPQFHCLEDVTGAGKTEAALMLVHRLMAAGVANGLFVALPTMATANAMYARLTAAYQRLFNDPASLVLATSGRTLVDAFAATVVEDLGAGVLPPDAPEGDPAQADQTASARCAAWLADHHKRALLSPAGVGTIDQALLAVLHSKHQSLRLLGLANKVLVVDEVHACDDYMLKVLSVLLEFHARGGGSAVLLSATLPQRGRQALLAAFARGLGQRAPQAPSAAYPLATSWPAAGGDWARARQSAIDTRADVRRRVAVQLHEQRERVLSLIRTTLASGQCVCWVRNTVADALDAFSLLQHELPPGRLWLFHARFALHDRLAMEQQVLQAFGKASGPAQRAGRVLIATQVVEQSLDVDFDVLVSDLAPIDRLVQRAGRLRRHRRAADGTAQTDAEAADARGMPVMHVLCPAWSDSPGPDWYPAAFPRAAKVYPNHAQSWLTMQALREGHFTMPDDARRLVEGVFGDEADVPPGLQANALAAEGQGFAAQAQAMTNTLSLAQGYSRAQTGGVDWWSDAHTPSRLGEATTTVTLARWDGIALRPWVDRRHGWAYSSLRVAERAIASALESDDPALRAAVEAVKEQLPAQGRWSVLLPLCMTADGWIGDALAAPARGRPARATRWRYDPARGLEAWRPDRDMTADEPQDGEA